MHFRGTSYVNHRLVEENLRNCMNFCMNFSLRCSEPGTRQPEEDTLKKAQIHFFKLGKAVWIKRWNFQLEA